MAALGIVALEQMRHPAGELDHVEPALDVAFGIGDDFAMFLSEQMRELVHVLFEQRFEVEHHPGAALRIGRRPARLCPLRGRHRRVEHSLVTESNDRLDLATVFGSKASAVRPESPPRNLATWWSMRRIDYAVTTRVAPPLVMWLAMKSSLSSIPRPGPSGAYILPPA
jgi:hypothetical protein